MNRNTVVMLVELPFVLVKVAFVLGLLAAAWLGWAIAAGVVWHYTGNVGHTVLAGMCGLLLAPLATVVDAIP
jgi:hypothetical protein